MKSKSISTFSLPISNGTSSSHGSTGTGDKIGRIKLTPKERARVNELIKNAKSLQEISRLEKELNEGRIPGGGDPMEE
jgi:U2 small nuclear ribonucleoprotein A'